MRRRRALSVLRDGAPYRAVLFICLGNVCRSPYAEYALRDAIGTRRRDVVSVDSAGFIGPGRPSPDQARAAASERGLDLTDHVSKVVTAELAGRHDLVVVMDPKQLVALRRAVGSTGPVVVLGDLDPLSPDRRAIPDPWGRPPEEFRASFDRVDRCLERLTPFLDVPS